MGVWETRVGRTKVGNEGRLEKAEGMRSEGLEGRGLGYFFITLELEERDLLSSTSW